MTNETPIVHWLDTLNAEQQARAWAERHGFLLVDRQVFARIVTGEAEVVERDADGTPTVFRDKRGGTL